SDTLWLHRILALPTAASARKGHVRDLQTPSCPEVRGNSRDAIRCQTPLARQESFGYCFPFREVVSDTELRLWNSMSLSIKVDDDRDVCIDASRMLVCERRRKLPLLEGGPNGGVKKRVAAIDFAHGDIALFINPGLHMNHYRRKFQL